MKSTKLTKRLPWIVTGSNGLWLTSNRSSNVTGTTSCKAPVSADTTSASADTPAENTDESASDEPAEKTDDESAK